MSRLMDWTPSGSLIVDTLDRARKECNADEEGNHATQTGTYGRVVNALIFAIATEISGANRMFWPDAAAIARRLYDEAIDNGENIRYQVDLWNKGIIGH